MEESKEIKDPKDLTHITLDENKDYFFGVRHGQRDEARTEMYPDIVLTEYGKEQARSAGKILKELFSRSKIAQLTMIVSPFLRAIQTANEIAKECEITDLKIDTDFIESLYAEAFKESPTSQLRSRTMDVEEFCQEYLDPSITLSLPTDENWQAADRLYPESVGVADQERLFKNFGTVS